MNPSARRRIVIGLGVFIAVAHVAIASWRATHEAADLVAFHNIARHWWRTGELTAAFGGQFYLPAFVVLMAPVAALPLPVAGTIMGILNILLLILIVWTCSSLAARGERLPIRRFWVWPMLLVFPFASGTIVLGQVNLIILWLCLLAYRQVSRRHDTRAGLLIALAAALKLYPLIFACYWLLKGRWRVTVSAGLGFMLVAGGTSLAAFGWQASLDAHQQWLNAIQGTKYRTVPATLPTGTCARETAPPISATHQLIFTDQRTQWHRRNNQSLAVIVRRLITELGPNQGEPDTVNMLNLTPHQACWIYNAVSAAIALCLAGTAWRRRHGDSDFAEWSGWLASVIAFVPVYWTHYFILLLPALVCLGVTCWRYHQQGGRTLVGEILQVGWLISIPLLAWPAFRLAGGNGWMALAVMTWAVWRGDRRLSGSENRGVPDRVL